MRYFLISCLLLFATHLCAQSPVTRNRSFSQEKATAPMAPASKAIAWKMETRRAPYNENAWLEYYLWTARDKTIAEKKRKNNLEEIRKEAGQYISGRSSWHLMQYLSSARKDTAALWQAYTAGNKLMILPYLVQHSIRTGNAKALERHAVELSGIKPLRPWERGYHYNVLQSALPNSVVYAQGLNDLVPMAILQQVHGVRKDLLLKWYDGHAETGSYLCLSLGAEILRHYQEAVYTGLLVRNGAVTDPAELATNLLQKFNWAYLSQDVFPDDDAVRLQRNYLPALLSLYKSYDGDLAEEKAVVYKRIQLVAARTGDWEALQKQLQQ